MFFIKIEYDFKILIMMVFVCMCRKIIFLSNLILIFKIIILRWMIIILMYYINKVNICGKWNYMDKFGKLF